MLGGKGIFLFGSVGGKGGEVVIGWLGHCYEKKGPSGKSGIRQEMERRLGGKGVTYTLLFFSRSISAALFTDTGPSDAEGI